MVHLFVVECAPQPFERPTVDDDDVETARGRRGHRHQEVPGGMDMAYQASLADEGGVSLRFVRGFDITANRFVSRFDILWGGAVTLPNFGCRRTN